MKNKICILISVFVLLIVGVGPRIPSLSAQNTPPTSRAEVKQFSKNIPQLYLVTAIVDGDTIIVDDNGREQQIRMLGIDTPELRTLHSKNNCFSHEATLFTTNALRYRLISLEPDPQNRNKDDYGRWLRYVDIPLENGKFMRLNEMLTIEGYAKVLPQYPLSEIKKYQELEKQAKEEQRGLWRMCN